MKKVTIIYDDRIMPGNRIRSITGDKSFGETILKRVALCDRVRKCALDLKFVRDFEVLKNGSRELSVITQGKAWADGDAFVYMYSNFAIRDEREFSFVLQKAVYADGVYVACCNGKTAAVLIPDRNTLIGMEDELASGSVSGEEIKQAAFTDLSVPADFLSYITGGFDARFFNALEGDEYSVTKRSAKKEKIRAEFRFYELLPDEMKQWFVMPYAFSEDKDGASYRMERVHTTDIAIRFVHGAVSRDELSDILERLFYFLSHRAMKEVSAAGAQEAAEASYITKVRSRIEELKKDERFSYYDNMIRMGTDHDGIDSVIKLYEKLYHELRKAAYGRKTHKLKGRELALSHGDLCFSNILYSREAGLLKLIDPKGALTEDELYMDPYYDIAKLSHSVCGGYDFFNSGLYQVCLTRDLKWSLDIDADLDLYREVFREFLDRSGYDYDLTRICEAGLFLSMLPLHMDQPGKVFGFLLNAIEIMDSLKR